MLEAVAACVEGAVAPPSSPHWETMCARQAGEGISEGKARTSGAHAGSTERADKARPRSTIHLDSSSDCSPSASLTPGAPHSEATGSP